MNDRPDPAAAAPGPGGTVHTRPDGRRELAFRREFPDPVDEVWAAVTDPARCARWFASWTGDARPGGTIALTMTSAEDGGGPPETARITACEPPHRLAVTIEVPDAGPPWELAVDLTSTADGGTVLEFRQPLPDGASAADTGSGWHWYLDRLAATLAGAPMPEWEPHLAATTALYPN
ncbi:SRPBCC family protein [Pseudonocardia nematodicida]|uniref:SRPBCC family protein n=1 Tax=Pseudonocardia nematodicida TaxID=1206997 RepID=A0ABV1KJ83_9PSEU